MAARAVDRVEVPALPHLDRQARVVLLRVAPVVHRRPAVEQNHAALSDDHTAFALKAGAAQAAAGEGLDVGRADPIRLEHSQPAPRSRENGPIIAERARKPGRTARPRHRVPALAAVARDEGAARILIRPVAGEIAGRFVDEPNNVEPG